MGASCSCSPGMTRSATPDGDFCRSAKCPICGNKVYFIRHNGGSIFLDELGWPWPKHDCLGIKVLTLDGLFPDVSLDARYRLGRVAVLHNITTRTRAAIQTEPDRGFCVDLDGPPGTLQVGKLVCYQESPSGVRITTVGGAERAVLPNQVLAHDLGLPKKWAFAIVRPPYTRASGMTSKQVGIITCSVCQERVLSRRVHDHVLRRHPGKFPEIPVCGGEAPPNSAVPASPGSELVRCPFCNASVKKQNLERHKRRVHSSYR